MGNSIRTRPGELQQHPMPIEARAAGAPSRDRPRSRRAAFREAPEREADVLEKICQQRDLQVHFQPIIRLDSGDLLGYEALTRPPLDGPFSTATELFGAASRNGLLASLELACCEEAVQKFARLGLRGRLLLNMSPESIIDAHLYTDARFDFLRHPQLATTRIVVELAEQQKETNLERLCEAVMVFRSLGADIAINDLGRGFSSLWLWSELRPEIVKMGMHFVHGVHRNAIKYQFLKSIQQIAEACGSSLVAEGIEDKADCRTLRDMGIAYGQGNFIARPASAPQAELKGEIVDVIRKRGLSMPPELLRVPGRQNVTGDKILVEAAPVSPRTSNEEVFDAFDRAPGLHALAVVEEGAVLGIINRNGFLSQYVRQGTRQAHANSTCAAFMDAKPLLVERRLSIQEISERLIRADLRHLEGFVFTDGGKYAGLGAGQDLMREILLVQIEAARYANPLTMLPGNVPIDEQITALLSAKAHFVAAYADLNHFKSFNDAYGYRRGDEMIKLAARILGDACDPRLDFLGHIGGDDFIVLFRSTDWHDRCRKALENFSRQSALLFDAPDRERGTLEGQDRAGNAIYSPLTSLAVGIVPVSPAAYESHLEVAGAAAEAKKQAKRLGGNALFIERRRQAAGPVTGALSGE
jgi:diguanylate cyclase (GGDEF)-like protein